MNPNEFVRALIDGTTRFVTMYLTFVFASMKSPSRLYARQYYRSYIASDREISASGFLAVTVLVVVFGSPWLSGTMRRELGVTKYATTLSESGDLTLSIVAAAIVVTLLIEMAGRLVFARLFIHKARTTRFKHIWLLAMASTTIWTWLVFWLLFWASKLWPAAHAWFTAPNFLVNLALAALVSARQLSPLARYMRECRDRHPPRLRSRRIWPALLAPGSALLLAGMSRLFFAICDVLLPTTKTLSIVHLACDTVTPPREPIRGSIVISNETSRGASFYASFHLLVNFAGGPNPRYTPLIAIMSSGEGANLLYLKLDEVGLYRFSVLPPEPYRAAAITLGANDCIGVPPKALPRDPNYQD
jgi:hypothetical protein